MPYLLKTEFQEIVHAVPIKEVMNLTEEEKIQASADLAEAVYFLHGHSPVHFKVVFVIVVHFRLDFRLKMVYFTVK